MAQIQKCFGRTLPLAQLFRRATIEDLARDLRREPAGLSRSPLVVFRAGGKQPPFFAVHAAGGTVHSYRSLARHLAPEQPFFALQARGLDGVEEPCTRVDEMARSYVAAVRKVCPRGPYRLGGWSFGGLVAFEMARQLLAEGEEVAVLALLDTHLPRPRHEPDADEARTLAFFAREAGLPVGAADLRPLGQDERLAHVLRLAAAADVLPAGTEGAMREALRRNLSVRNGCLEAAQRYRPQSSRPYPGRITLLAAAEPPDGETAPLAGCDPSRGWGRYTSAPVSVHTVPGNHWTMLREPHAQVLAAVLGEVFSIAEPQEHP
jgi:thioesterase domain-containing protein